MTLLLTEIHKPFDSDQGFTVFAADRRITKNDRPAGRARKVFPVPSLAAGIGYFGLAEMPGPMSMTQWLSTFLAREVRTGDTLRQFADRLADELNATVPPYWHKSVRNISGFHIAGFTSERRPEFWFVHNVRDDRRTMLREYEVREDFQRRDIHHIDPKSPDTVQVYRNGDFRSLISAWKKI